MSPNDSNLGLDICWVIGKLVFQISPVTGIGLNFLFCGAWLSKHMLIARENGTSTIHCPQIFRYRPHFNSLNAYPGIYLYAYVYILIYIYIYTYIYIIYYIYIYICVWCVTHLFSKELAHVPSIWAVRGVEGGSSAFIFAETAGTLKAKETVHRVCTKKHTVSCCIVLQEQSTPVRVPPLLLAYNIFQQHTHCSWKFKGGFPISHASFHGKMLWTHPVHRIPTTKGYINN